MDDKIYEKGSPSQYFWIATIAVLFSLGGIWLVGG